MYMILKGLVEEGEAGVPGLADTSHEIRVNQESLYQCATRFANKQDWDPCCAHLWMRQGEAPHVLLSSDSATSRSARRSR
jgi:hypothetical protein